MPHAQQTAVEKHCYRTMLLALLLAWTVLLEIIHGDGLTDEIMQREQSWRKTEELMRAALTRRMKLLELARDVKTTKVKSALNYQDTSALDLVPHSNKEFVPLFRQKR